MDLIEQCYLDVAINSDITIFERLNVFSWDLKFGFNGTVLGCLGEASELPTSPYRSVWNCYAVGLLTLTFLGLLDKLLFSVSLFEIPTSPLLMFLLYHSALTVSKPKVSGLVLVLIDSMDICYTSSQLHKLNCHYCLDISTYEWCKTLGIVRRPHYIHRSAKHRWIYNHNPLSSIPVVCSQRSKCYHSYDVTLHCSVLSYL